MNNLLALFVMHKRKERRQMFEKIKNTIVIPGEVIHLNDKFIFLLLIGFIYGVYLLFAYNIPIDAEEKGMDWAEASYNRKKQRKGCWLLLGCCLVLAIVSQIGLIK